MVHGVDVASTFHISVPAAGLGAVFTGLGLLTDGLFCGVTGVVGMTTPFCADMLIVIKISRMENIFFILVIL